MAYDVAIRITSEADLKALKLSEEATRKVAEELKNTQAVAASAAAGADRVAKSMQSYTEAAKPATQQTEKMQGSLRTFGTAVTGVVGALGNFGPAINIAVNALQTMFATAGPLGLAIGVLAAAVGFATSRITKAREEAELLAERGMQKLQREAENLKLDQAFRQQIKVLESLDPEMESSKQKYEEVSIAAQKNGASQDTLARIARAAGLEQKKLADARLEAAAKEQQAIQAELTAADFRIAKIGVTGDALHQLTLTERLHSIAIDSMGDKYERMAKAAAEVSRQRAQDFVQGGRAATTDFQNQFGVTFDIEKQIAGSGLADKFAAVFNTFKNDPRLSGQLSQAFSGLVREGVRLGVPDLPELLIDKLGSANFERLRAELGDDIKAALDSTTQAGQQWGESFADAARKYNASAAEVGVRMDDLNAKARELQNSVERDLAMSLDVNQPLSAVAQVQAQLAAIPDVTYKQVIIQTYGAGSPVLPFSDYVGYMHSKINDISNLSPEVMVQVPDFSSRMRQAKELQEQIRAVENEAFARTYSQGASAISDLGFNRQQGHALRGRAGYLRGQLEDLQSSLARDVSSAQPRASAGGGGGGGGGNTVNITINLNGALTSEVLDRELLPKFEQAVREATGTTPNYRVLN